MFCGSSAWLRKGKARDLVAAHGSHPDFFSDLNRPGREVEDVVEGVADDLLNLQRVRIDLDHMRDRHREPAVGGHLLAGRQQRTIWCPSQIIEAEPDRDLIPIDWRLPAREPNECLVAPSA